MKKRIGVLTSGGDVPGINNAIKWVTKTLLDEKITKPGEYEVIGIKKGFRGLHDNPKGILKLDEKIVRTWDREGGTKLGSSRYKLDTKEKIEQVMDNLNDLNVYALVVIGGNDHMGYNGYQLQKERINVIGIPKTIDGDVYGTEKVIGFDTELEFNGNMIKRLKTTAGSHDTIFFFETMGRKAGWLALKSAKVGQVNLVLIPEYRYSLDHLCEEISRRRIEGARYDIVVVSEGAWPKEYESSLDKREKDEFGNIAEGGVAAFLEQYVKNNCRFDTRKVVLGHLQRGGAPNHDDLQLSMDFGITAAELIKADKFGNYVVFRHGKIKYRPLEEKIAKSRGVTLGKFYDKDRLTYKRRGNLIRV